MRILKKINWVEYWTSHIFSFGQKDGLPYTETLYFRTDGRIHFGQKTSSNETYWRLTSTQLEILNENMEVTTTFELDKTLQKQWIGTFKLDENIHHVLNEVSEIQAIDTLINDASLNLNKKIEQAQLQQFNQLHAWLKPSNTQLVKIAFVVNAVETLDALIPLMLTIKENEQFELKILTFNRFFRGDEQLNSKTLVEQKLSEYDLTPVLNSNTPTLDLERLSNWSPDYLVRQSEWDADFPAAFAVKNLWWTKLIHIAYTVLEDFIENPNSKLPFYTQEYYENIWRTFIPEQLDDEAINVLDKTFIPRETYQAVGSIKALQIKKTEPVWPNNNNALSRVIWMPHHSVEPGWFQMGTFIDYAETIYNWAVDHPNISILLNPHPSLDIVIKQNDLSMSIEAYNSFIERWEKLPNTEYLVKQNSYPAVAASDVILTDGISILYEGQILEKPIVYLERSDHVKFTPAGEKMMRGVHRENKVEKALQKVEHLLHQDDELRDQQIENVKPWVSDAHPEQKIINAILADFNNEN